MDLSDWITRLVTVVIFICLGLQIYSAFILLQLKKYKLKKSIESRFSYNAQLLLTIPLIIQIISFLIQSTYGVTANSIHVGPYSVNAYYPPEKYIQDTLTFISLLLLGFFLPLFLIGWVPKDGVYVKPPVMYLLRRK